MGIEIEADESDRILKALGLEPLGGPPEAPSYRPPSWRADLTREIDLIEEVARIHGYEQIPEDRPVPLARSSKSPRERVEAEVRAVLTGLGFDEAYTFSLVAEPLDEPLDDAPARPSLRVDHSSRRLENALRQSLVPSLLAARAYNEARGNTGAAFFEVADVYRPTEASGGIPDQAPRLALVGNGDFFAIKGVVEALLERLHVVHPLKSQPTTATWLRTGRAAALTIGGEPLGFVGEVDPARGDQIGLRGPATAAELRLDRLIESAVLVPTGTPPPAFPAVDRDLSLVVDRDLPWAVLESSVRESAGPHLESLRFLDSYEGGNIPTGRLSLHFALRFRDPSRTLTGEDVERTIAAVVDSARVQFGAELR